MKKIYYLIVGIALLAYAPSAEAQTSKKPKSKVPEIVAKTDPETKKAAAAEYKSEHFKTALGLYLSLQKGDSLSVDYNYKVAKCILNLNMGKAAAIPFLKYLANIKNPPKDFPKDVQVLLAKAYHLSDLFDEAIEEYEKYRDSFKGKKGIHPEELQEINTQIAMCRNGSDFKEKPLKVIFENLGPFINSSSSDYNAFISADQNLLVYSTRRPGAGLADDQGVFNADIYFSTMKEGKWQKAKSIGTTINTPNDEEVLSLSADGKKLLIYSNVNQSSVGDIYLATLKGKTWGKAESVGPTINSIDLETGATLSPDGKTLFFASDHMYKDPSKGERDLYKSVQLPDGKWGDPVNLGPEVNTPFDEDAPFMHADGKTLYFSSKGHRTMGGFDIFKTVWDDTTEAWSEPENIGYPINNAEDNLYFSLSRQGKYAYVSALRPEGLGDLDIYKVNFTDIVKNSYSTIITGVISTGDSSVHPDAQITFINKSNPDQFGQYRPSATSGKYVISTGPGTFLFMLDAPGYATVKEEFTIPELNQPENLEKNFTLTKNAEAEVVDPAK